MAALRLRWPLTFAHSRQSIGAYGWSNQCMQASGRARSAVARGCPRRVRVGSRSIMLQDDAGDGGDAECWGAYAVVISTPIRCLAARYRFSVSTLLCAVQQRIYNEIQIHYLLFTGPPMSSVAQSLATGDD